MEEKITEKNIPIHPEMTLLDIVSKYRGSEEVFRRYDEKAGVCLCCEALFESLETVAANFHLDLTELIQSLKIWVSEQGDV